MVISSLNITELNNFLGIEENTKISLGIKKGEIGIYFILFFVYLYFL
jgi:hypothetical protein